MNKYKLDIFENFDRKTNSLITKFLILPISRRFSLLFINYTNLKPYHLTFIGLFIACISAYLFFNNNYIYGAFIFQFALIFDSIDGYVARVKNNGSLFGIILDSYVDFLKILINSIAIIYSKSFDITISILFIIFIILNLFESYLDLPLNKCLKILKKKKDIKINFFEKKLLNIKDFLAKKGLRTIFYYTQERYFVIFFLAPILNELEIILILNLIFTLIFIHMRIFLDLAIMKSQIINNTPEELKYRDFV